MLEPTVRTVCCRLDPVNLSLLSAALFVQRRCSFNERISTWGSAGACSALARRLLPHVAAGDIGIIHVIKQAERRGHSLRQTCKVNTHMLTSKIFAQRSACGKTATLVTCSLLQPAAPSPIRRAMATMVPFYRTLGGRLRILSRGTTQCCGRCVTCACGRRVWHIPTCSLSRCECPDLPHSH
jgi:hypothetical protein